MSQKPKIGIPNILDKPIPKNPRYEGMKPTIDTGASMPKHLEKLEKSGKLKAQKKDELFKRVKVGFVAGLLMQQEHLIPQVPTASLTSNNAPPPITRATSTETLVGTSLHPTSHPIKEEIPAMPTDGAPSFLLLDARLAEDYEKCRIKGAITYPSAILTHAMNYFTTDIFRYKNKDGKYIIVYDEDETVASKAATTFFQKGVDNIYMLSGGMREMYDKFPDLVIGEMPPKPDTPNCGAAWFITTIECYLIGIDSRASSRAGTASSTTSKASTKSTLTTKTTITKRPGSTMSNASTTSTSKAWK